MPTIRYGGENYRLSPGETILDGLLRHGVEVSYSCRSGVCQSCLLKSSGGPIPELAQVGLKDTLRAQGYFLACRCEPESDLTVSQGADQRLPSRIAAIAELGSNVLSVALDRPPDFEYRAGQFLTLFRTDGLARSYSLASLPSEDKIGLHIRLNPGGAMSEWLRSEACPGAPVSIQGPSGNCFYLPGQPEEPLLLAGTGTGLAPLQAIARDALAHGHTGPIWLFHGALDPSGLYLEAELQALAARHPNFRYVRCVLRNGLPGHETGALDACILDQLPKLAGWKAYVCGDPAIVNLLRRKIFLAGAASRSIYADPFLPFTPASAPTVAGT